MFLVCTSSSHTPHHMLTSSIECRGTYRGVDRAEAHEIREFANLANLVIISIDILLVSVPEPLLVSQGHLVLVVYLASYQKWCVDVRTSPLSHPTQA